MAKKYAYCDLDGVAYIGASIAQKLAYVWKTKEGVTPAAESEVFDKAAKAKEWYEQAVAFGLDIGNPDDWERLTITKYLSEEEAIKFTEEELQRWVKTVHDLFSKDAIFKGYLTCSGWKNKDLDNLERRYQHNRYECEKTWTPKIKPRHLKACRRYLLTAHSWITMSPKEVEADAIVIALAERRGKNAVIGLKDKDLQQAMNGTNYINMNDRPHLRKLITVDGDMGYVGIKRNAKDQPTLIGDGFKFMCSQTIMGDSSDGYHGVKGMGAVNTFEMFDELTTPEECCAALADYYEDKFPAGIKYHPWKNPVTPPVRLSAMELLKQHMFLAYHERSPNEKTTPIERYLNDEEVLYTKHWK